MKTTSQDTAVKTEKLIPLKGAWYKVTGRRGNAKAAFGVEGACIYTAENFDEHNRFTGYRLGLKPVNGEAVWVAATQVTLIPTPASAVTAPMTALVADVPAVTRYPMFMGLNRTRVIGLVGDAAGKQGDVFWHGADKRNNGEYRIGFKTATKETVWCGARDVVGPPSSYALPTTLAECVRMVQEAETFMLALDIAGHVSAAEAWSKRAIDLSGLVFAPVAS